MRHKHKNMQQVIVSLSISSTDTQLVLVIPELGVQQFQNQLTFSKDYSLRMLKSHPLTIIASFALS